MWWFGYPNGLSGWLKDFKTDGWDQDDLRSAIVKLEAAAPCAYVELTHRQMEAVKAEALARSSGGTLVATP